MIDWETALYGQIFGVFGVTATLDTGTALTDITVIDQTSGIEIMRDGIDLPVVSPAVFVKASEMASKGLSQDILLEATLSLRGYQWTVKNVAEKPGPNGKATGEWMLLLINGDL